MLFASLDFLLFLPPVLAAYWLLRRYERASFALLLAASYFFYSASGKPAGGPLPTPWYFVFLLVLSTVVDYVAGLRITERRAAGGRGRGWLVFSVLTNLLLLGYFKYTGFLFQIASDVGGLLGVPWAAPTLDIALPIGISFYTFQSLSYTISVYRGTLTPERSLLRFALFVAFFPQLVAGPIVRATDFLPQLRKRLDVDRAAVDFAFFRITKGLIKKVFLGDFIAASFADAVFSNPSAYSSLENLFALYAFTLQIYADFSGYSDVAIGVARLFGFRLPENFDRPYQSASVGEFWRRWHMTLSTWLRDYLFFPLGGSRGSSGRTYFNLWLTMFLVGMWHGASWNFVIYANLQAAAMLLNRFVRLHRRSSIAWLGRSLFAAGVFGGLGLVMAVLLELRDSAWGIAACASALALLVCALPQAETSRWSRPLHVFLTFHFVVLSRVFFRADSFTLAQEMWHKLLLFDGYSFRPGLFRVQGLHEWVASSAALPPGLSAPALWITDFGLLACLLFGVGFHFTRAPATDGALLRVCSKLPAWALAPVFAAICAFLSQLLHGPRANIYFAF